MLGGTNLSDYITKQLPVFPPETYDAPAAWEPGSTLSDWISSRVLELTYTAWDLAPFARDLGHDGPPFAWDPERRFRLRSELDAAYFHLYGIAREDVEYIMDTFPIVRRKDEAAHGEYRTRRVILEIYDHMARAAQTGQPYQTPLDPPPVDLATGEPRPATVTPLRPRTEPRPETAPSLPQAAEDRDEYAPEPPDRRAAQPEEQTNGATDTAPPEPSPPPGKQPQPSSEPVDPAHDGHAVPEAPNLYEAALALHACVPDGEKVERDTLLADAARELGHPKLTKKVRSALNKALKTEQDKGRLKTDWQVVWKPKKK